MTPTSADSTLYAAVRGAAATLADAGVAAAEVDAVELAAHALGVDGSEVRRLMVMRDQRESRCST
jgi:release factor glutamine methyltransferase